MSTEDVDETQEESYDEQTAGGEESAGEGEFYAEPKKKISQGTVVIILLLVAVLGATYFMVIRTGPSAAQAGAKNVDPNGEKINSFLGKGQDDLRQMQETLKKTEAIKSRLLNYPSAKQIPVENLQTNPFQLSHVDAPQVDLDAEAREAQVASLINAAKELHLQSVLMSSTRRSCIIDGKVYNEGQNCGPFKIAEIRAKSIVLSNGTLKLEVSMATDQQLQAP